MLMTQGGGRRAGPLLVVSRLSQARMVLRMGARAPRVVHRTGCGGTGLRCFGIYATPPPPPPPPRFVMNVTCIAHPLTRSLLLPVV